MLELLKGIQTKLAADATLKTLLGGSANVGQAQSPATRTLPCVAYQVVSLTDTLIDQTKGAADPLEAAVLFTIVAKDDSSATYAGATLCQAIADRLRALLHGGDISYAAGKTTTGLTCRSALFDGFESGPEYDPITGEWRLDTRFAFVVAQLPATG